MINIKIKVDTNKILKEIIVKGHSHFTQKGKDIVCAAVSVLVYSAYLSFCNMPDIKIDYIDDKNKLRLSVNKLNQEVFGELRGISIYLITGIKALAKEYVDNIKLELI